MLGTQFYHETIRKMVVSFGTIFNNINLVRKDNNGYIYVGKHEGWYCTSDETFLPESQVTTKMDDVTNTEIKISME